jgi:hypothetical protein
LETEYAEAELDRLDRTETVRLPLDSVRDHQEREGETKTHILRLN